MKKTKIITVVMAVVLTVSMLFTACGGGSSTNSSSSASDGAAKAKRYTSTDKKVVTLNGELKVLQGPVLVTSAGQSADVSMIDVLMKKVGADYTFNATAKTADIGGAKTVLIAAGASSKGLGAAGISADNEKARTKEILEACKKNNITVIMAHLGGVARRGKLSDEFSDMVLEYSSGILMVEDGNDDGKFSDFAQKKNIPITLVNTIADCMEPLKTMFGK